MSNGAVGEVVGSKDVGEIVGDVVGSELVGEMEGDTVGSEMDDEWSVRWSGLRWSAGLLKTAPQKKHNVEVAVRSALPSTSGSGHPGHRS